LAALEQLQGELGISHATRSRDDSPLVDAEDDDAVLQEAVQTLSDALIRPIASALKALGGLIIVPYRELGLIPFSLLTRPNGTLLVEDFALSVSPSMATLSLIQKRKTAVPGLRSFIAGDPAADPKNNLIPLPGAAAEAETVQGLLLSSGIPKDQIKLLTHEDATEELYRQSARGCRLVHLACHATLRQPAVQSALFLAPGPHDDGQLYPPEIADIGLDNAVVFLSACQTGLGRPTADGVLGLSRAFLEAGACAVIMSLWKVADESTSVLAGHFYRALLGINGQPSTAAQALQLAMKATRKDLADGKVITKKNELLEDHPAHWAPFLLLGEGGFLAHG
jgi:CHAT domain-containing protein